MLIHRFLEGYLIERIPKGVIEMCPVTDEVDVLARKYIVPYGLRLKWDIQRKMLEEYEANKDKFASYEEYLDYRATHIKSEKLRAFVNELEKSKKTA
jgi:hypothetical protein